MRTKQNEPFAELLERQLTDEHYHLLREANASTDAFIAKVRDICEPSFERIGRLKIVDLESLQAAYADKPDGTGPIFSRDMERSVKTAFRNEYAFERLRLHALPGDAANLSWLWTSTFYASSKIVVLENSRLPFAWSTHAMSRLMERGITHHDPRGAIAKQVLEHSFLISVASDLIETEGLPPRFSIPMAGGILAGFVRDIPTIDHGSFRMLINRDLAGIDPIGPASLTWRAQEGKSTTGWIGRTYVGADMLTPAQRQYAYDLTRIQRRYRVAAKEVAQLLITMTSMMKPPEELSRGISASLTEAYEGATDDMREFLHKHRHTRACGIERGNKRRRSWIEQQEELQMEEALTLGM